MLTYNVYSVVEWALVLHWIVHASCIQLLPCVYLSLQTSVSDVLHPFHC